MRHKVLLPTDFSKNSIRAINYARELYKDERCDFYLLNVFSISNSILEGFIQLESRGEEYESAQLDSENGLAKVYDMITMSGANNSKHHFDAISQSNNVVDAIKDIVDKKDIEMIVMGTKGETDSRITAFGSTATYVMEKVRSCPVLVVPETAKIEMPKEIVFPTDYKIPFKSRELVYIKDIARKSNAKIAILHVEEQLELGTRQKENKQLLEEILHDVSYKFHNLSHTSVITAVNIFVESRESDMVAFLNKKHKFFGSILTSPMVKNISFHLNIPILALHDLTN